MSNSFVLESPIYENDNLVVTIYAAGLDGIDKPALAFVIEREDGVLRQRIGRFASPVHENHQIALAHGIVEAAKEAFRRTTIRIESTSKGFLIKCLNEDLPIWKSKGKWPKKTGKYFKEFERILTEQEITLAKARHIANSPALSFAQEMVARLREKMRAQKDNLLQDSPY